MERAQVRQGLVDLPEGIHINLKTGLVTDAEGSVIAIMQSTSLQHVVTHNDPYDPMLQWECTLELVFLEVPRKCTCIKDPGPPCLVHP